MDTEQVEAIARDHAIEALEYCLSEWSYDIERDWLAQALGDVLDYQDHCPWEIARYHSEYCDETLYVEGRLDRAVSRAAYSVLYAIGVEWLNIAADRIEDYVAGYVDFGDLDPEIQTILKGLE